MAQVRRLWFPAGKAVAFCPAGDPEVDELVRERILSRIEDVSVVVPMPEDRGRSRRGTGLPERLLLAFMGEARPPFAIVFKPYFSYERVEFGDAVAAFSEGRESVLKRREARLRELAGEFRERMSVYI